MVRARAVMVLIVFTLLLVPLALATPPALSCLTDADCSYCSEFTAACHCDISSGAASGFCVPQGTSVTAPAPAVSPDQAVGQPAGADQQVDLDSSGFLFPSLDESPMIDSSAQLAALEQRVNVLEQQTTDLSSRISQFEGLLQSLQQQMGIVANKQELASLELNQQLNALSTGLAGLQKEVNTTSGQLQSVRQNVAQQESQTNIITYVIIIAIILGIAGAAGYYFFQGTKKKSSGSSLVQPEVLNYITSHIKTGKKFSEIKENLLKAGWPENDIQQAYKETMKHNYQQYQKKKGLETSASPHSDQIKIASIAIVSVLLIVGVFFLLRGVTGQAIHFSSEQELDAAVKGNLEVALRNREFPPLVNTATICVEVHDLASSSSYRIIKLPEKHIIQKAPLPCSDDPSYDLALKFNNWDPFNILTRRMTCEAFQSNHGKEGFYVLPSRYVLPGFTLNPAQDPTPFCAALAKCVSPEELARAGINC